MVTKNIVEQPKSKVEVQVSLPWEDVLPKWDETLHRLASEVEIAGFRKGQAPLPLVEQHLGSKFTEELLKVVMPQALVEALQGSNIIPIDYPQYSSVSLIRGQPLTFKAMVTKRPQVQILNYKNITVKRPEYKEVTDEKTSQVLNDMFNRWKSRQKALKPQPDSTGSEVPDDEFAKSLGAEGLADLKTKMKKDLENEAKYNNELDFEEAILQEVEKLTQVDVPEVLVDDELNRMLVSLQRRVAEMGLLLEDYLKGQNKTLASLKQEWRAQSEKNVRMELGLSEIARQEKIEISEAEVQAEIDKIPDPRMKEQFKVLPESKMQLMHSLRQIRTLDYLKGLVKAV